MNNMDNEKDIARKSNDKKDLQIRSSTSEYLTYIASSGESGNTFEVRYEDENIWLIKK